MTVVVRLGVAGYPIMVGDLLLSGYEVRGHSFNIPTVGNVTTVFAEGAGFTPTGLNQKIALIGDNLVIAWSGRRIAARAIIKELIEKNKHQPFSRDSLVEYFKSVDPLVMNQGVGFLGFIKDASGIAQLGLNCKTYNSEFFGEVGFLGTVVSHGSQRHNSILTTIAYLGKQQGRISLRLPHQGGITDGALTSPTPRAFGRETATDSYFA